MRKALTVTTLMLAFFFAGCSQEKAQVTEYLKQLDASNTKMKTLAEEMQQSMSGVQQEMMSGTFDAEKIKANIKGFSDKMAAEKQHIESLQVPAKAQALHGIAVKQYQTAVDVLNETPAMIDIAKKMADGAEKVKKDPKQAQAVMAELKTAQDEMMAIQQKITELAKQGKEFEDQAKAEQKKLEDEFGIQASASASPAAPAPATTP